MKNCFAILAVLANVAAGAERLECREAGASVQAHFGGAVTLHPKHTPCRVEGDFNGDGVRDAAFLVRLGPAFQAKIVANPWSRQSARAPRAGDLAIAIVLGGATGDLVLLGDRERFASPIWESPDRLLAPAPRKKSPGKGQALAVATEAGADELVYWNGSSWRVQYFAEAE
jgi:hypothetical protein